MCLQRQQQQLKVLAAGRHPNGLAAEQQQLREARARALAAAQDTSMVRHLPGPGFPSI